MRTNMVKAKTVGLIPDSGTVPGDRTRAAANTREPRESAALVAHYVKERS